MDRKAKKSPAKAKKFVIMWGKKYEVGLQSPAIRISNVGKPFAETLETAKKIAEKNLFEHHLFY